MQKILQKLGIDGLQMTEATHAAFAYGLKYQRGSNPIVEFGVVKNGYCKSIYLDPNQPAMRIKQPVYYAEFNWDLIVKALKKKTADTFLTIGFLNGFLPCGLVYMAVFASLAMPSPTQSILYMVLFGLGTIPLMTTAIYIGKFLNRTVKQRIQKAIPVFVVLIGLLFILRGLGLGIPYVSPAPVSEIATSQLECH